MKYSITSPIVTVLAISALASGAPTFKRQQDGLSNAGSYSPSIAPGSGMYTLVPISLYSANPSAQVPHSLAVSLLAALQVSAA